MSWLSYIFPVTAIRTTSPYSSEIRVNEERGQYKLLVNGSRQSGKYIHGLWSHALKSFHINNAIPIRNVLVLGVAGGTIIHILHELYPNAEITGVDIDSVMIEIGKKYFRLTTIPSLTVINADAKNFVQDAYKKKVHYDMIVIDVCIGRNIPEFVTTDEFLREIKDIAGKYGIILINYLRELEYQKKSEIFAKTLKTVFPSVTDSEIALNRFFCCRL